MTERRQRLDRRAEPCHGRRTTYQSGCRCSRCQRAEADYRRALRYQLCRGKLPLGARVDARRTHRLIVRLVKAGYRKAQIAAFLGLKRPILEAHPAQVTQRTAVRMEAVFAAMMAETPETVE